MKCIIWLILTFGFIIHPDYNAVPLVVDDEVVTEIIKDTFADGTKADTIELVKEGDTPYLVRKGFDAEKNCHISRTELLFAEVAVWQTYMMPVGGVTETCTGVGCTHCGFKKEGGCKCENFSGRCDHTISRNTDMLRIFR